MHVYSTNKILWCKQCPMWNRQQAQFNSTTMDTMAIKWAIQMVCLFSLFISVSTKYVEGHLKTLDVCKFVLIISWHISSHPLCIPNMNCSIHFRIGHFCLDFVLYLAKDDTNITLNLNEDMVNHSYYFIMMTLHSGRPFIKHKKYPQQN